MESRKAKKNKHVKPREVGAFFSLIPSPPGANVSVPWPTNRTLWGSGRDALRALLNWGGRRKSWSRIWIPGYFCPQVTSALRKTEIEVVLYDDGPEDEFRGGLRLPFKRGDVFMAVNFFGLRGPRFPRDFCPPFVEIVEDHTHDPLSSWACTSKADWCVASLRKTLPLPDGGILWSPLDREGPPSQVSTLAHERNSSRMLAAMMLKSLYLRGLSIPKNRFRDLAARSEKAIGSGAVSGMTTWSEMLLATMPVRDWRRRRSRNAAILAESLCEATGFRVLSPEDAGAGCCPFGGVLIFKDRRQRDKIRARLVEAGIYPVVLWPLVRTEIPGISEAQRDLSRRIMILPCDMRYNELDMKHIARHVLSEDGRV